MWWETSSNRCNRPRGTLQANPNMARALFHAEINEIRLSTVMRRFNYTVSAVADSLPNDVTNLRDVIDVPVPVIDVGDSSLHVLSLLSDAPTVELSGILSTNSVMIPLEPVLSLIPTVYQRQVH